MYYAEIYRIMKYSLISYRYNTVTLTEQTQLHGLDWDTGWTNWATQCYLSLPRSTRPTGHTVLFKYGRHLEKIIPQWPKRLQVIVLLRFWLLDGQCRICHRGGNECLLQRKHIKTSGFPTTFNILFRIRVVDQSAPKLKGQVFFAKLVKFKEYSPKYYCPDSHNDSSTDKFLEIFVN